MNTPLNLARLITVCDGIIGRKKLQKIVHLLQVAGFREQFPYEFGYLHFGPYSHSVKNDLDLLIQEDLVHEEPMHAGEHTTFRYMPVSTLAARLDGVGVETSPAWSDLARHLGTMTPQRLEAASTISFLRERGFNGESLRSRFGELKPSLDQDFDAAMKLVVEKLSPSHLGV